MTTGSNQLLSLIKKHVRGNNILEVGPFFNPITTDLLFKEKNIIYWENDSYVLNWLKKQGKNVIFCDLNINKGKNLLELKTKTLVKQEQKKFFTSTIQVPGM